MPEDIRFERRGHTGLVTLTRGHALNALTHQMVLDLAGALDRWERDANILHIVVQSADERAFSAGGDIRALHDQGLAAKNGKGEKPLQFFADEYRLNIRIKTYPKPFIALIDGIVMGGGVGISVNGSHRIAGGNIGFAMPEVGIGFFPDVGATWFLPRLPGETGTWLALTGTRIGQADCLWSGIATHAVAGERFDDLVDALASSDDADEVLQSFNEEIATPSQAQAHRSEIAEIFRGDDLLAIAGRLSGADGRNWPGLESAAKLFSRMSPTSLSIALCQMRFGASHDFAECMRMEYRIVNRVLDGVDFYEGVRAQIIDKDRDPAWSPRRIGDVTRADIDRYFSPLEETRELPTAGLGDGDRG